MSDLPSPDRYVVVGHPIEHSKSPLIHAGFAAATRERVEYTSLLAPLDGFACTVRQFARGGGKGFNVTVPFKEEAWRLVDVRSERAELAGAVNTVTVAEDGRFFGDNTDGIGLVTDLVRNHQVGLAGQRLLILGAGGAARGVVAPVLAEQPTELVLANRTVDRAQALARDFAAAGMALTPCGYEALAGRSFDVIINATAAGLHGAIPPLPSGCLAPGGAAYDMVYSDTLTAFQRWAIEAGAGAALDGLGMLVEQAAAAFEIWRGVRPQTAEIIATLRENRRK